MSQSRRVRAALTSLRHAAQDVGSLVDVDVLEEHITALEEESANLRTRLLAGFSLVQELRAAAERGQPLEDIIEQLARWERA